ncbi:homeobox domain protein [Trichinella nativa]|uniref:Homeobox domain protein n=1 Tax=Trichinella nativa TaxID=6335 RepID=A0A1Y3EQM9_9BILA|nr:homeobox domain protein [Trichinella nativa]
MYPTTEERRRLSEELNISFKRISSWFNERRRSRSKQRAVVSDNCDDSEMAAAATDRTNSNDDDEHQNASTKFDTNNTLNKSTSVELVERKKEKPTSGNGRSRASNSEVAPSSSSSSSASATALPMPKEKEASEKRFFNDQQRFVLESVFQKSKYITSAEQCKLARKLNVGTEKVNNWFNHRRKLYRVAAFKIAGDLGEPEMFSKLQPIQLMKFLDIYTRPSSPTQKEITELAGYFNTSEKKIRSWFKKRLTVEDKSQKNQQTGVLEDGRQLNESEIDFLECCRLYLKKKTKRKIERIAILLNMTNSQVSDWIASNSSATTHDGEACTNTNTNTNSYNDKLTPDQLCTLSQFFQLEKYPSGRQFKQLAKTLNLSERKVKNWFTEQRRSQEKNANCTLDEEDDNCPMVVPVYPERVNSIINSNDNAVACAQNAMMHSVASTLRVSKSWETMLQAPKVRKTNSINRPTATLNRTRPPIPNAEILDKVAPYQQLRSNNKMLVHAYRITKEKYAERQIQIREFQKREFHLLEIASKREKLAAQVLESVKKIEENIIDAIVEFGDGSVELTKLLQTTIQQVKASKEILESMKTCTSSLLESALKQEEENEKQMTRVDEGKDDKVSDCVAQAASGTNYRSIQTAGKIKRKLPKKDTSNESKFQQTAVERNVGEKDGKQSANAGTEFHCKAEKDICSAVKKSSQNPIDKKHDEGTIGNNEENDRETNALLCFDDNADEMLLSKVTLRKDRTARSSTCPQEDRILKEKLDVNVMKNNNVESNSVDEDVKPSSKVVMTKNNDKHSKNINEHRVRYKNVENNPSEISRLKQVQETEHPVTPFGKLYVSITVAEFLFL